MTTYWGLGSGTRATLQAISVYPHGRTYTLASEHWHATALIADGLVEITATDRPREVIGHRDGSPIREHDQAVTDADLRWAREAAGKVPGIHVPSGTRAVTYTITEEGRRVLWDRSR